MTVNVISTVNGLENEGMRNVATHILRHGDELCKVRRSALSNPLQCIKNTFGADAVVIFARASSKVAKLASVLRVICKKIYIVLVQKPEPDFLKKAGKKSGKYSYFAISRGDGKELSEMGNTVHHLPVGIDTAKFHPPKDSEEVRRLREKYGFDERPLVVHVGHLSQGRGLEKFLSLSGERYNRLVVASGMFSDEAVRAALKGGGVTVIEEYLEDISEVYRMADVYLFPTESAEFVISIPLSVMEALACGVPVVTYGGVPGVGSIGLTNAEAVVAVSDSDSAVSLENAVSACAEKFSGDKICLLMDPISWRESAKSLFGVISVDANNANAK